MSFLRTVWAVFVKDLKIELCTKEITLSTFFFALIIVIIAAFALDMHGTVDLGKASGVLWIAVTFAGILALGKTFEREKEFGAWTALALTPSPKSAIYLGKTLGVFVFLTAVEVILVPLIDLFFHSPFLGRALSLAPVMFLATLGYSALGTLFAGMTIRTRQRDLLLGMIIYPLLAPLVIAAQKATAMIAAGQGFAEIGDYFKILLALDTVFILGGLWLFGPVMED